MRASRLNSIEKSATRVLSGFLRHNLSKLQHHDPNPHAFRPLGRPVFQTAPVFAEQPEPQLEFVPVYQEPKPQLPVHVKPVAVPAFEDIPLPTRMVAMEWQRRQQRLVAQINASLPSDRQVTAYNIVPADLFLGDVGRFLMMACDFYSHCFANTLILPMTPSGAAHFGLPQYTLVTPDVQLADARARIIQLRTRVANEHGRVAAALARGDVSLLFRPNSNRPDYKQELVSICRSIAINTVGLSAFVSHESRFYNELRDAGV